jgi:nucleotide-binding universal stress UspA family protein
MMRRRPMFQRILAGTDGTAGAEEAVRQAARLARLTGAALEVVHVERPPGPGRAAGPLGNRAGGILSAVDGLLAEAGRIVAKEECAADLRLLVGEPAEMLAAEAVRRWSDLVCVGPDARFRERPHLLGGVAAHLIHRGVRPTLVARPPGEREGRPFPARILVAVDGSETSTEAVRLAAAIAVAADADVQIMHTVPVTGGHRVGWTVEGRPSGFEPLEPALELARGMGARAGPAMALGRPGPAIAASAADWDADLVVVGALGLGGIGRLTLGSVSDWVVRHAGRSVLVARNPKEAG